MALIQNIDSSILYFIQNHIQNQFFNPIMIFITNLGNMGLIWITIAIALLFTNKFRKVGILMLCALIINTILGEIILKFPNTSMIAIFRKYFMVNIFNKQQHKIISV